MNSFCGCEQHLNTMENGRLRKWSQPVVTWTIQQHPSQFQREDYAAIIESCFREIMDACGFVAQKATGNSANIVFLTERIDGRGGTLAYAELAGFGDTSRDVRRVVADSGEAWAHHTGAPRTNAMPIRRVVLHELLHALGIGHEESQEPALMDPTVSNIQKLQRWDIDQLQARYGKPQGTSPAPVPTGLQSLLSSMTAADFFRAAAS